MLIELANGIETFYFTNNVFMNEKKSMIFFYLPILRLKRDLTLEILLSG
jgi:hypothetical protein